VLLERAVQHRHVALAVAEHDRVLEVDGVADEAAERVALLVRLPPVATRRWVIVAAVEAARATSTLIGLCRKASASRWISGGMVAEKNRVCRVKGTSFTMRSMSGMNPMSSMRSASSMTRSSTPESSSLPRSK
jgi:hypothetical protein